MTYSSHGSLKNTRWQILAKTKASAAISVFFLLMVPRLWADSQKEYIYLDGMVVAVETSNAQNIDCSYNISPANTSVAYGGGSGSVTTTSVCAWTASSNDSWITVTSGSSGSGNGTVSYSVAANTGAQRTGTITIAEQTFAVTQDASPSTCTYSISPTDKNMEYGGGGDYVTVTTTSGCDWTATSDADSWIKVTGVSGVTGNGTVSYSVAANNGPQRQGTITIAGKKFMVTQDYGCTYSIVPPTTVNIVAGGSNGVVTVNRSNPSCPAPTVTNAPSWIITSVNGGNVSYWVTPNYDTARTGTVTISGNTFTVEQNDGTACTAAFNSCSSDAQYQAAVCPSQCEQELMQYQICQWDPGFCSDMYYTCVADCEYQYAYWCEFSYDLCMTSVCNYSISQTSISMASGGGSNSVNVTTTSACDWTASSNVAWVTITSGDKGSGNGIVYYTVAANSGAQRQATLTIAEQTFTVTQDAPPPPPPPPCTYNISPTSAGYTNSGGSGSVNVTTTSACDWTASSNVAWVTITSGDKGSGNGTVYYTVAANSGPVRNGAITAAGKSFTVSQSGLACQQACTDANNTCNSNAQYQAAMCPGQCEAELMQYQICQWDPGFCSDMYYTCVADCENTLYYACYYEYNQCLAGCN